MTNYVRTVAVFINCIIVKDYEISELHKKYPFSLKLIKFVFLALISMSLLENQVHEKKSILMLVEIIV